MADFVAENGEEEDYDSDSFVFSEEVEAALTQLIDAGRMETEQVAEAESTTALVQADGMDVWQFLRCPDCWLLGLPSDFKMCNGGGHVTCGLCRIRQERINECSLCKRQLEDPNPLVKQLMEAINFPCPLFCGKLLPVSQRLVHNVNCSAVKLTCPLCFTYESYSAPEKLVEHLLTDVYHKNSVGVKSDNVNPNQSKTSFPLKIGDEDDVCTYEISAYIHDSVNKKVLIFCETNDKGCTFGAVLLSEKNEEDDCYWRGTISLSRKEDQKRSETFVIPPAKYKTQQLYQQGMTMTVRHSELGRVATWVNRPPNNSNRDPKIVTTFSMKRINNQGTSATSSSSFPS